MMRKAFALFLALGMVSASTISESRPLKWDAAISPNASYARPIALARAPYGYLQFCDRNPTECDVDRGGANIIRLDDRIFALLETVNKQVNHSITEISDMEHYHVPDYWTLPTDGKGDCEDFQLQKRHNLVALGFPRQALMMGVVRDENDEGHAVLLVRTDRGDLVLDNRTDLIRDWQSAPYDFVKRQSQDDPMAWVYIGNPDDMIDRVASGGR